jgi:hypothetical protein
MKITTLALLLAFLTLNIQAETLKSFVATTEINNSIVPHDTNHTATPKPFYEGEVVSVAHAGAYTYIEVKEATNISFWIAVTNSDVKAGDFVRFQKELVMKDFKSKALDRVFPELMFASHLQYKVKK